MIYKIKQYLKSKTINYALLLVILGSLQQNFDYLKPLIGEKNFGLLIIVLGIIVAVLRTKTVSSIKDK